MALIMKENVPLDEGELAELDDDDQDLLEENEEANEDIGDEQELHAYDIDSENQMDFEDFDDIAELEEDEKSLAGKKKWHKKKCDCKKPVTDWDKFSKKQQRHWKHWVNRRFKKKGFITWKMFKKHLIVWMYNQGMCNPHKSQLKTLHKMIKGLDADHNGRVTYWEFLNAMKKS